MRILEWQSLDAGARRAALARPTQAASIEVCQQVQEIIARVRRDGDAAVRQLTAQFDRVDLDAFAVTSAELAAARLDTARADKALSLAGKSYYPDLTVSAGFMYRGQLPPMWLATIAGPVPIFSGSKQSHAVAENGALLQAAHSEVATIEQLLRLRSEDRHAAFSALRQTIDLYQQGLLVQSAATTESTLAQYQVGKVAFASVLEANAGLIADQDGYLESVAAAERLLIAEAEVSLATLVMPAGGVSASSAMPGAQAAADDSTSGM